MMTTLRLFAAILLIGVSTPALALDDCILDKCQDKAPPVAQPGPRPNFAPSSVAPGSFDFYVLSLSWSPGFCELSGGGRAQCEPGSNLGFVVHGLWPQYEHGFPSNCGGAQFPSSLALQRAKGVYPDQGLARYEWRKHGTCTGRSPGDYFDDVARAKALVAIPPSFAKLSGDQTLDSVDLERAFIEANPRLRPGMLAVGCERGVLQEVRICLTKDLRDFRACPEVAQRGCHARQIRAPAPY
jgi:ribonuclease T2